MDIVLIWIGNKIGNIPNDLRSEREKKCELKSPPRNGIIRDEKLNLFIRTIRKPQQCEKQPKTHYISKVSINHDKQKVTI